MHEKTRPCGRVFSFARRVDQFCDGVFSAKYSWLSALSTAAAGSEIASAFAPDWPYTWSSVPATTLKWMVSWISVPAFESVPVSGADQNARQTKISYGRV